MSKHTPGPWAVGKHPGRDAGTDLREVTYLSPFGRAYICEAEKANARLIAAAPELLEALHAMLDCPGIDDTNQEIGETFRTIVNAAIAKAEGS